MGNITFVPRADGGIEMSFKCDKCRKLYEYRHDGDCKNPRLKEMMNGIFICGKCHDEKINKFIPVKLIEHQYLADNILGVIA